MNMDLVRGAALMLAAVAVMGPFEVMAGGRDVVAMMEAAKAAGRAGLAQKSSLVDARPAQPGEVIVTMIVGEGKETQSKPAETGDWVVRNRCPATGDEEYLVKGARFAERYTIAPVEPALAGWRSVRPSGKNMRYMIVTEGDGDFSFIAPWGEEMVAKPGDALVQDPDRLSDTYRVAAASFACTYEIITPAS